MNKREHLRISSKGGKTTLKKYGTTHFSELGAEGYAVAKKVVTLEMRKEWGRKGGHQAHSNKLLRRRNEKTKTN